MSIHYSIRNVGDAGGGLLELRLAARGVGMNGNRNLVRYKAGLSSDTLMKGPNNNAETAELAVLLMADRSPWAYCELLTRNQYRTFWFAPHGCPDAVEAVLWRWFERGAPSYDPARPFDPFFVVSVHNEHKSRVRARGRTVEIHDLEEDEEPRDRHQVVEDLLNDELSVSLAAAVEALPPLERAAIAELFLNGQTFRSAASALHRSVASLQRTANRALRMLEVALAKRLGIPSKTVTAA